MCKHITRGTIKGGNIITLKDKRWHLESNCNQHPDPDLWHYENSMYADEQQLQVLRSVEAIQLCHSCPVKAQCLEQGMETDNIEFLGGWGTIWGGLLMSERYAKREGRENVAIERSESRHRRDVRRKIGKLSV